MHYQKPFLLVDCKHKPCVWLYCARQRWNYAIGIVFLAHSRLNRVIQQINEDVQSALQSENIIGVSVMYRILQCAPYCPVRRWMPKNGEHRNRSKSISIEVFVSGGNRSEEHTSELQSLRHL